MMHEREKSDPVIVAAKPTNKVATAAAEPVEPRTGAVGNASQQSTLRTQGRERATQALERVRQAARLRKKEKFTALLHHVNVDLLRESFLALKRKAAPGVDGLTWQSYAADLDRNSLICMHEFIAERTGLCHRDGRTYRRAMANSARWRWRQSRTRLSRERPPLC